jgi:hypothetical protein
VSKYKTTHLPVEEIDRLRFKAFASNKQEDILAYYKATALYFLERHERAMNRESANSEVDNTNLPCYSKT